MSGISATYSFDLRPSEKAALLIANRRSATAHPR